MAIATIKKLLFILNHIPTKTPDSFFIYDDRGLWQVIFGKYDTIQHDVCLEFFEYKNELSSLLATAAEELLTKEEIVGLLEKTSVDEIDSVALNRDDPMEIMVNKKNSAGLTLLNSLIFAHGSSDLLCASSKPFSKKFDVLSKHNILRFSHKWDYLLNHSRLAHVEFPLIRYGIDWFGPGIACFGIVSIIWNIIFEYENQLDMYASSDINSLRVLRASLLQFSRTIDHGRGYKKIFNSKPKNCNSKSNHDQMNQDLEKNDFLYWKYSSLIVLGMINFCRINSKIPKNIDKLKSTDKLVKRSYYKVRSYIKRFVIDFIVPNVVKLYPIECHNMMMISPRKYSAFVNPYDILYWRQLFKIIVTCMNICHLSLDSPIVKTTESILKFGDVGNSFPQRYVNMAAQAFVNINNENINRCKSNCKSPEEMKKILVDLSLVSLPVLNPETKRYDAQNIMKNAKYNQYSFLSEFVLNPSTRNKKLFQKWKNVTSIKSCNQCGRNDVVLRICKSCKFINVRTFYCSKKCQKKHWNSGIHPVFSSQSMHTQIGRCSV